MSPPNSSPRPRQLSLLQRFGLSLLSGALLAASFPPYDQGYLLPVGIALLAVALRGAGIRDGIYLGLASSCVHAGATLFWFSNLFGAGAISLCAIVASFGGVFGGLWSVVGRRTPPWAHPLAFALLWVGIEVYHSELFVLNFGWNCLGYTTAGHPAFTPLAATVGVYGISFLAIALSVWSLRHRWGLPVIVTLWLLAWALKQPPTPIRNPLVVRLVQASSDDDQELFARSVLRPADRAPDVILWPEYALQSDPRVPNPLTHTPLWPRLEQVARTTGAHFVFGAKDYFDKTGRETDRYRNTAYVIAPDGALLGAHVKNHPVHLVKDGVAGTDARAIPSALGPLGVSICFDNDYPEVDRKLAADGAVVFLVPNMDPLEWGPIQPAQHRLLFAMRAMENGRWLARADVAGGTSAVAPNGVEIDRAQSTDAATLTVTVGRTNARTLYTRGGWVFGPLCLIGACALSVYGIVRMALARQKAPAIRRDAAPESARRS